MNNKENKIDLERLMELVYNLVKQNLDNQKCLDNISLEALKILIDYKTKKKELV